MKKAFLKILHKRFTLSIVILFLISILLTIIWFRDGKIYGGGDIGLPTYNPIRILQIAKFIWWQDVAPGFLIPQAITSITLYYFLSFFQLLGIGPLGIQAILFCTILFFMGFGMYLLTLSIIGKDKKIYAIMACLFYMFNPYMMTQIWHRFSHTSMLFVAAIPFLILFWRFWIKRGDYLNLLYFLFVSFSASYMFGTIAFVFPVWLILTLFTISEIFFPWENEQASSSLIRNKSHSIKILWRFALGLVFWVLLNCWWLIPVLTISQGVASQQHNIWESIATLLSISKQAILPYSLQMGNSFYLFEQAELGQIYKSFFFRLIPWLGVVTVFYGIIYSLQRKHLVSLVLIFFILIMLAKGTSSPFGQPFLLLFSKSFAFGLLRNPFEKIGILLPLVSSILFTVGIERFFNWPNKILSKIGKKIFLTIWLMIMGIYYWPMYQGTIFGSIGKPSYIEVPKYYEEANKWLDQKVHQDSITDGKILHLPLTRRDIATYNWKYGYHGVESSALMFTSLPSISHGVSLKNTDDGLTALSLIFHYPYNLHPDKILKLLQDFNVRFIILHKDIMWKGVDIYDPEETEKLLNSLTFLQRKEQFGELMIYEILPEHFKPKIILTNTINFVYPQQTKMRMWPYLISENLNDLITPLDNNTSEIINRSNEAIIFPDNAFTYLDSSEEGLELIGNNLVIQLYNLSNTRDFLHKVGGEIDTENLITQLITSGEDVVNIYVYLRNNDIRQLDFLVHQYGETIDKLFEKDIRKTKLTFFISPSTIDYLYKLHLLFLEKIEIKLNPEQGRIIERAKSKIKQDLNNYKLLPLHPLDKKDNLVTQNRQINDFNIPRKAEYELLMINPRSRDIYPNKLAILDFQINDHTISLETSTKGDLTSFGKIMLNEGLQEISFNHLLSENLLSSFSNLVKTGDIKLDDQNNIQLFSDGLSTASLENKIDNLEGEEVYEVSFEALLQSGTGFYIQIIQDTDGIEDGRAKPTINTAIYRYTNPGWQTYKIQLSPLNLTTRQAVFRLIVDPQGITSFNPSTGSQPVAISLKNLRLQRVLNNPIYLSSEFNKQNVNYAEEVIQLQEENAVSYKGKIRVDQPTFLIFKESFDAGWKLELKKQDKIYKMDQHYISNLYGNGWWIDKTGEYDFKIEFEPQRKVTIGSYIAIFGGGVLILLIVFQKFKKNGRN